MTNTNIESRIRLNTTNTNLESRIRLNMMNTMHMMNTTTTNQLVVKWKL